jgi:hypothetical protein
LVVIMMSSLGQTSGERKPSLIFWQFYLSINVFIHISSSWDSVDTLNFKLWLIIIRETLGNTTKQLSQYIYIYTLANYSIVKSCIKLQCHMYILFLNPIYESALLFYFVILPSVWVIVINCYHVVPTPESFDKLWLFSPFY